MRRSAGGGSGPRGASPAWEDEREESLQRAIFAAWADRLARRREPGSDRAVMVGGRGGRLARESAVQEAELFVCVSLDDRSGPRSEALVRIASAVERNGSLASAFARRPSSNSRRTVNASSLTVAPPSTT